jgi:hypothetical protein
MRTWVEEYKVCGCSLESADKQTLAGYCPRHGSPALRRYRLPDAGGSQKVRVDYTSIDADILRAIRGGKWNAHAIVELAEASHLKIDRAALRRIVSRRLQALRKRGEITFCWIVGAWLVETKR